jgi:hypothetical protein
LNFLNQCICLIVLFITFSSKNVFVELEEPLKLYSKDAAWWGYMASYQTQPLQFYDQVNEYFTFLLTRSSYFCEWITIFGLEIVSVLVWDPKYTKYNIALPKKTCLEWWCATLSDTMACPCWCHFIWNPNTYAFLLVKTLNYYETCVGFCATCDINLDKP